MLTPITYGLAVALDLFVIVIGARFLLAPQPAAAGYGVPATLRDGFAALHEVIEPLSGDDDPDALTETFWSGLHGLLTLMRSGRLRPDGHDHRLALLVARFSPPD